MALENARMAPPEGTFVYPRQARWRRAIPALLLTLTLAVVVVGLYALGQALKDWAAPGPSFTTTVTTTTDDGGKATQSLSVLAKSLTRYGWSQPGVPVDALLITPAYFRGVGWPRTENLNTENFIVFLIAENIHDEDLPPFDAPLLVTPTDSFVPESTRVMADSPHHRAVMVAYNRAAVLAAGGQGSLDLAFPQVSQGNGSALHWNGAPLLDTAVASGSAVALTSTSILALLAGLLVSMWPCLFQLTAYFIPSLAGISMREAKGSVSTVQRLRVVKMAFFFVSGFVIVYTLAGAAAGLAAQSFDTQSAFETWRRPMMLISGVSMLVMGLRQLGRARLPLVCKMPLMTPKKGTTPGYGTAMVMGLAYATGCATCFGAAVLLGMLVYVGVAGAPFTGAAVMFVFSVGMGIPLIIGASLMAQVLPMLDRLQNGTKYLSMASAAMMLFMAFLLLSDRFMGFSNFISQSVS
ncbi:MAG: cytochrome c biogenesis protein CcdA [Tepidiformaceae bacterium]